MLGPSYKSKQEEQLMIEESSKLIKNEPEETDPILGEPLFIRPR
jgi:hypothetical protein